jgi:hypothetical protein
MQVEVVAPVIGHFAVDRARALVVQEPRVSILPYGSEGSLEDVHLLAGPAARPQDELERTRFLHRNQHLVVHGSHPGPHRRLLPLGFRVIGVLVCVDVDELEIPEIDRVTAEDPCAVDRSG